MIYKRLLYGSSLVIFLLLSQLTFAQSIVDFSQGRGFGILPERPDLVQINSIRIDTIVQIPFEVGRVETAYYNILLRACESGETVYLEPILGGEEPNCVPSRLDFSGSFTPEGLASFDRIRFDNVQRHVVVSDPNNPVQTTVVSEPLNLVFRYDPIMVRLIQVVTPRQITISLNWGENPRDLDAHLTGPACTQQDTFDFSCNPNDRFHIYFKSDNADIASMEIGEFSETRPEYVTIRPEIGMNTLRPGLYRYVVHHFVGTETIANSNAIVRLHIGDEPARVFTPPPDHHLFLRGEYDTWTVFELLVTDSGMVEIIPIQRYNTNVNPVADIY
jgi:hypothetical protein